MNGEGETRVHGVDLSLKRILYVRWNLAPGHYASALTQPDDAAGREKRAAALRQAIALLDESTAEAKQLSEARELRRLIDEELAKLGRK